MHRLLTLIKKTVGKSKAEKSKSLHSMTMINVASAMTKETWTVHDYFRNEFPRNYDLFARRDLINKPLQHADSITTL